MAQTLRRKATTPPRYSPTLCSEAESAGRKGSKTSDCILPRPNKKPLSRAPYTHLSSPHRLDRLASETAQRAMPISASYTCEVEQDG